MARIAAPALIAGLSWLLSACSGLPETTRTGTVAEIVIADQVAPRNVRVHVGDEVRWVNRRATPVWVNFLEDDLDELACQRGFHYVWGIEETAKLKPGESVSACFAKPGLIGFEVEKEALDKGSGPEGGINIPEAIPGSIQVIAPAAGNAPAAH
jgi:plastocyanin